jgi:hypothetical protein
MPQGYYTIEQWKPPKQGSPCEWVEIMHLPFGKLQTDAEHALQSLGKPGLYRLVQMQRVIWAEQDGNDLKMRKSHASSPDNLDDIRQLFERTNGRYAVEEAKEARRQQKIRSK